MNKLTLKILILFFLFIYSHELTDSQIIRNETKNFIQEFTNSCKKIYKLKGKFSSPVNKKERCIGYCHQYLHTKFPKTMKIKNIPHGDFTKVCEKLEKNWNNQWGLEKLIHFLYSKVFRDSFLKQYFTYLEKSFISEAILFDKSPNVLFTFLFDLYFDIKSIFINFSNPK